MWSRGLTPRPCPIRSTRGSSPCWAIAYRHQTKAMLISGGKQKAAGDSTLPFKIVTGHGAWVLPVLRKTSFLTLAMREAAVTEECVTQQGIALTVRAVIAFKVGSDPASIAAAAQRFLADQGHMDELTGQIFAGHLRSIVGSMTVEAIIRERQTLAENVLDASKIEMAKIGLTVDSLQIQSIDDKGSGYIKALAAPHQATVNQAAQIAQAQADQASAKAQQESQRNQAEYARPDCGRPGGVPSRDRQRPAEGRAGRTAGGCAGSAGRPVRAGAGRRQERRAARGRADRRGGTSRRRQRPPGSVPSPTAQAEATTLSAGAAAAQGRIALDQAIISPAAGARPGCGRWSQGLQPDHPGRDRRASTVRGRVARLPGHGDPQRGDRRGCPRRVRCTSRPPHASCRRPRRRRRSKGRLDARCAEPGRPVRAPRTALADLVAQLLVRAVVRPGQRRLRAASS